MPTVSEQLKWKMKRQKVVNTVIESGEYKGWTVDCHIRGSLYSIVSPEGNTVFVSHRHNGEWHTWVDKE